MGRLHIYLHDLVDFYGVHVGKYLEIPNASKFSCHSGKTRFFQMAPNIFGLRRVLRMHTFSSFSSFRDVKPSLRACFLKLCSCAMFACGCAMFACGYAVLARDRTHFLDSTSCCLFVEWWDFAWLRHVFPIAPCFCRCTVFLLMRHYFLCFRIAPKILGARFSRYTSPMDGKGYAGCE